MSAADRLDEAMEPSKWPTGRGPITWMWHLPGGPDIDLWIRGERLRVNVPEQDRRHVARSLARLARAVNPDKAFITGDMDE